MRTTGFGAAKHHSWHQTAFASLHGFVLPCRDKVFPSSPQFCPILTTFLYPRVISTSSVHQCHKAQIVPVCWQHFLFPSYNPVGYEGTCLWEYILFLDSHLQCALRAPSSTVCQWNRALGSGTHCPLWDRRRIQDLYPRAGQAEVQGGVQLDRKSLEKRKTKHEPPDGKSSWWLNSRAVFSPQWQL